MKKYLVVSDVHIGHPRTPTSHIIRSFISNILTKENRDADVLFINGDLFDRLLDLGENDSREAIGFCCGLLGYCADNNIALRVLEGTPSHDWQQSRLLLKLKQSTGANVDLVYHSVLAIEFVERLGQYVLFIPDEWVKDHAVLEKQIQQKLDDLGIEQVDLAMLHGQFTYQVRGNEHVFCFNEDYFLQKVKAYIHVGHYHTYSRYDRIIANGSLERLQHGEEEPKGYVRVCDGELSFLINDNAKIYKTLRIKNNVTLEEIDRLVCRYPAESHIRLVFQKDSPYLSDKETLRIRYANYYLKIVRDQESEKEHTAYLPLDTSIQLHSFNKIETVDVSELVRNKVIAGLNLSTEQISRLDELLVPLDKLLEEPNDRHLT